MAYRNHDPYSNHAPQRQSHEQSLLYSDGYSGHFDQPNSTYDTPTTMRNKFDSAWYPSDKSHHAVPRRSLRNRSNTNPKRWPPGPSVEDEGDALANELSVSGSIVQSDDEPRSRGTVNQYPIIQELEQPPVVLGNEERRYILVSDPQPSSNDNEDPPVFTKRVSTPYAYTKPQKESLAPGREQIFLSPDRDAPAFASAPRVKENQAEPLLDKTSSYDRRRSTNATKANASDVFEDSDSDTPHAAHLRAERRPARYSFVKGDLHKEDMRAEPNNNRQTTLDTPTTPSSEPLHPSPVTPRSSTQSFRNDDRISKAHFLEREQGTSTRYPASRQTSCPGSPSQRNLVSPPRSPKPSPPATSRPPSRSGPRQQASIIASRPASKSGPRPPPSPIGSRASSSTKHSSKAPSGTDMRSSSPTLPNQGNHLPYPVDDRDARAFMPLEEHYQFDHESPPITPSPRQRYPDSPTSSINLDLPYRRTIDARRSADPGDFPRQTGTRNDNARSRPDAEDHDRRKRMYSLSLTKVLPLCPRSIAYYTYDDWYTLKECDNAYICPSCYKAAFSETSFAGYFTQSRRSKHLIPRVCDFSSPWIRLAWRLILKRRQQSLDLFYKLFSIYASYDPCPGDDDHSTHHFLWYGIRIAGSHLYVDKFALCIRDVLQLETLFPSIRGYFTIRPHPAPAPKIQTFTCSLRVNSRRFVEYIDLLTEIDAEAQRLRESPRMSGFEKLASQNGFKRECFQNKSLTEPLWHYMDALPEFVVCQECFDDCVWPYSNPVSPAYSTSAKLPKLIHNCIQPVPNQNPLLGSSCYLYSPRMREIWNHCVLENNFEYLRKAVLERKAMRERLIPEQKQLRDMMRALEYYPLQWQEARERLKANEDKWMEWE